MKQELGANKTNKNDLSKKINLIAFLNSYSEGLSGGDVRFIEVANRINEARNTKLTVVTSKLGKELCETRGLKAIFSLTSKEYNLGNILIIYAIRVFSALFLRLEIKKDTILYATSDFLPDVFPIYILKLRNKQVKWVQIIHHIQGNPFVRESKSFFVNLFGFLSQRLSFDLVKQRADLTIVVNPIIKKQLVKIGFNEKKVCINYNGVNWHKIQGFRPSAVKYDCVFLGRLNVSKGIFDLVKVWSDIVVKNPSAKLAIIGKGDSKIEKKLKDYTSSMQLQRNIDFYGHLNDLKAFGILKSGKVFLFPSYEEGFGIAILEAMACGLPVITYNLPVYKEIFKDRLITVPIGRTDIMSQKTYFLLENPEVARAIGKENMELVKRYDWDKIARQEILLIESVLKKTTL